MTDQEVIQDVSNKVPFREKLAFGCGDLASVLYWQTFMLYFTFFYTDVFVIPAAAAATMFLVSRMWDGVNDPLMGMIADRTQTRWGKFRPYLLWLCVPFAVAGVLTFTVPDFGAMGKLIWAYATFILIMMLYTAINIPYTALFGVVSADSKERTTVSSVKFFFAFAAGIIVSATLLPMAKHFGKGDESIIRAQILQQAVHIQESGKGTARLLLSAEDPSGLVARTDFVFRVIPEENNLPVLVNPVRDIQLEAGFQRYQIEFSDIFNEGGQTPFRYSVTNQNPEVVHAEVAGAAVVLTEIQPGHAKLVLTASDKYWGARTYTLWVDVAAQGNQSPVPVIDFSELIRIQSGFGRQDVDLSEWIRDPDGDALSFTVTGGNSQVIASEIEGHTLRLTEVGAGIASLTVTAMDGHGGRLVYPVKYLVYAEGNNPPYVNTTIDTMIETAGFHSRDVDIADVFVSADGAPLTYRVEIINEAKGWQSSFVVYGIAAVVLFLIAFKGTKERVQPPKTQRASIVEDWVELVTNVPWLLLLAATITFILFVAVRSSVTAHYFKYVVGAQPVALPILGNRTYSFETLVSAFNAIGQLASLLGVFFVSPLARLLGKKKAFVLLFVIALLSTSAFYFMKPSQVILIFVLQIVGSMTGGPLSVLLWAMYADTADYGEWKNGRRSTGLVFSASTMSQKFGWAFGAYVALVLMSQVGFEPNQEQSQNSLHSLILLFSVIPAGLGLLSLLLLLAYPLNEKRVDQIVTDLAARRRTQEEEAGPSAVG